MKKLLIALGASLMALTSVYAAEMQAVVTEVNTDASTVMLEDGSELTAAEGVDLSAIEAGATVNIMVDDSTGMIVEITVAE